MGLRIFFAIGIVLSLSTAGYAAQAGSPLRASDEPSTKRTEKESENAGQDIVFRVDGLSCPAVSGLG